MRKSLLVVLALLLPGGVFAEEFSVATFNAEFLNMRKVHIKYGLPFNISDADPAVAAQWDSTAFRTNRFDLAVDAVAEAIQDIDVNVLVLTEVSDGDDLGSLVNALSGLGASFPHVEVCDCTDSITGQHVAILSDRPFIASETRLQIEGRAAYDAEVDDPDEQLDTGISKGIRVAVEVENDSGDPEIVHIIGLHLASERGGHEQDQQRIAQASIVRRHAIELLNRGEHVIIAGDLNDRRGQPTLRSLDDIWPDLIQTGHHKFFEDGEESSRWTYQFRGELNQIDHVLLSYSLRRSGSSIAARVMDIEEAENPSISDHRPLIVTILMP